MEQKGWRRGMSLILAIPMAIVFGAACQTLGCSEETTMIVIAIIFAGGLAGTKD